MFPVTKVIHRQQSFHVEMVCLLSKLHEAKHHVNVTVDMNEMDLTSAESKATYEEIKAYVAEHNDGMQVSNLHPDEVADMVIEQFQLVANEKEEKEYRFGV